jgi:glutaredoxin-related protein
VCAIVSEFLSRAIRQEEEMKKIQIEKEVVKISLFVDNMILYQKEPKTSIRRRLDNINSFSKVTGYKINLQKTVVFLHTNNEKTESKYRNIISFIIASKRKYQGINLTKDVDLYKKNSKSLKKKVEDYRRWKTLPCSWIGRINQVKMAILPKAMYTLNAIPMKISVTLITKIEKVTLKFILKNKRPQIAK